MNYCFICLSYSMVKNNDGNYQCNCGAEKKITITRKGDDFTMSTEFLYLGKSYIDLDDNRTGIYKFNPSTS